MDLIQLAKDPESGRVGCPSVHLDRATGALLVQGDGVEHGVGRAMVRIKVSIVREALAPWLAGRTPTLADSAVLAVTGDEFDIALLPTPLPGERAVWSTADELLQLLGAQAGAVAAR